MKKKIEAWLVLAIIMAFAAILLAGTNLITKDVIAMQEKQTDENARKTVMPDAERFEALEEKGNLEFLYEAFKGEEKIGYVAAIHEKGFAGDIKVILGITSDGKISGINIGGSNFQETAGLGAKAKEPKFSNQFAGKLLPISLRKGGAEANDSNVDAITAATITSNAVVRAVNSVNKTVSALNKANAKQTASFAGGEAKASVEGFDGPVAVKVTFDKDAKITAIEIGDDKFNETPGLGALALEDDFKTQFIGKQAPMKLEDIDAISGATITSTAVIDAVNAALESISVSSASSFAGGEAKASVEGFDGPVAVKVTFDKDAKITAIEIGDDKFNETPGLGALALEDDFKTQFIGKQAPMKLEDIDAISGATITSTAVIDAVNAALESISASSASSFAGGEAKASVEGFDGPVAVKVTFDKDAKITAIEIGDDKFNETPGLGALALEDDFKTQFIGKQAPMKLEDIDAISGATITSTAVIDAVNTALETLGK